MNNQSRRRFLLNSGTGFGALALTHLLGENRLFATSQKIQSPTSPKPGHGFGRAKSVIFLFMEGGPSHLDLFDPKPLLNKLAGQRIPDSFGRVITAMGEFNSPLLECKREWKQHGQSGLWVSDWLPHTAACADDLAVIRSCWANGINHSTGICQMNTGAITAGRPSLGAWTSYGLGTENQNLPAFVVMQDERQTVVNGPRNWGAGFMPAVHQATRIFPGNNPITDLHPPPVVSDSRQRSKLDFLNHMNRDHALSQQQRSDLDARIASYELAFRMQAEAPDAVDVNSETESTKRLYGMDRSETTAMGRCCLTARRLVERGVRFVQIYHGAGNLWDSHENIEGNHARRCRSMDKPVAGLLADLKARGLLDETLVVWGGEFGRTPQSEKGDGRDHNPSGFTMWMAGGGVKGGQTIGTTDELGLHAIDERMHVHDLHATILHLVGIDNLELVYMRNGRPETPTINEGTPLRKIVTG